MGPWTCSVRNSHPTAPAREASALGRRRLGKAAPPPHGVQGGNATRLTHFVGRRTGPRGFRAHHASSAQPEPPGHAGTAQRHLPWTEAWNVHCARQRRLSGRAPELGPARWAHGVGSGEAHSPRDPAGSPHHCPCLALGIWVLQPCGRRDYPTASHSQHLAAAPAASCSRRQGCGRPGSPSAGSSGEGSGPRGGGGGAAVTLQRGPSRFTPSLSHSQAPPRPQEAGVRQALQGRPRRLGHSEGQCSLGVP